jgi:prepilin-type N-terminal cleavage/methylation domain-containing protein
MIRSIHKGFTIIELLVVIAIIGLLSSVILGAMTLGRYKAADANIKANLHTIQIEMEYVYDNSQSYGTIPAPCQLNITPNAAGGTSIFGTDPTLKFALRSALAQTANGTTGLWAVGPNGNSYAVAFPLRADSANWWCLDASGRGKNVPAATMINTSQVLGGGGSNAACP